MTEEGAENSVTAPKRKSTRSFFGQLSKIMRWLTREYGEVETLPRLLQKVRGRLSNFDPVELARCSVGLPIVASGFLILSPNSSEGNVSPQFQVIQWWRVGWKEFWLGH